MNTLSINRAYVLPYQVDCYTLLQENSTHTENYLRGVFSQATGFSPCVLLLRHLEALMQIAQRLDSTQGATTRYCLLVN
jgi:hypothetical protein